jgi:hypothetical protein
MNLVVGPRVLPAEGVAEVWIDCGSGPGYTRRVPVGLLVVASIDNGQGNDAIYCLHPRRCHGGGPAGAESNNQL